MVENDAPGWHGSFSFVGRTSAAIYNIKSSSNAVSKPTQKTTQDDTDLLFDDSDIDFSHLDIFHSDFNPHSLRKPKPSHFQKALSASLLTSPEDRYKFYQKHITSLKPRTQPTNPACTKYNPKMTLIWEKPRSGPLWEKLQGRSSSTGVDDRKYVDIDHFNISKLPKKGFIDLNKQTMRGGALSGNLRVRNEKKFVPLKRKKGEYRESGGSECKEGESNVLRNSLTFGLISKRVSSRNNSDTQRMREVYRRRYVLANARESKANGAMENKGLLVPDFRKALSRSDMDKGKVVPKSNVAIISPNVDLVKERPIMMVAYNRDKTRIKKNAKFEGIDNSLGFNIDKVYDKYNNHKPVSVPLFRSMTSRPNIEGCKLPSFMQQMFTRAGASCVTDKTLKMNNFSMGSFIKDYSSFAQKKSFNQMINMTLLNKGGLCGDMDGENVGSEFKDIHKHFAKSVEFYNKNYDELMNENQFKKIDNVTYKTEKRNRRYMLSDEDAKKFVINFEEVDQQLID